MLYFQVHGNPVDADDALVMFGSKSNAHSKEEDYGFGNMMWS